MNRSEKIFAWVLALYFGAVFILGFSGKLDQWETQGYQPPSIIIAAVGILIVAFILLACSNERFACWLNRGEV